MRQCHTSSKWASLHVTQKHAFGNCKQQVYWSLSNWCATRRCQIHGETKLYFFWPSFADFMHCSQHEKAMHNFFRDVRVYKRKEFFAASDEDVQKFFDVVEGVADSDAEFKNQWERDLAQAAKRTRAKQRAI